jgi:hypothetical protein
MKRNSTADEHRCTQIRKDEMKRAWDLEGKIIMEGLLSLLPSVLICVHL